MTWGYSVESTLIPLAKLDVQASICSAQVVPARQRCHQQRVSNSTHSISPTNAERLEHGFAQCHQDVGQSQPG
jgi:hypothetical protein